MTELPERCACGCLILPGKLHFCSRHYRDEYEAAYREAEKRALSQPDSIHNLQLSVRPYNVLLNHGIFTISDAMGVPDNAYLGMRNLGMKSLKEIRNLCEEWIHRKRDCDMAIEPDEWVGAA